MAQTLPPQSCAPDARYPKLNSWRGLQTAMPPNAAPVLVSIVKLLEISFPFVVSLSNHEWATMNQQLASMSFDRLRTKGGF